MPIRVARYQTREGRTAWGVLSGDGVSPLAEAYETTSDFFDCGGEDAANVAATKPPSLNVSDLTFLSPVTTDGDYLCQATNYASHVREIGRDPDAVSFNVFFHKASSCISSPDSDIVRPRNVQLLDYEVELALVIRRAITGPIDANWENLHKWVGAFVMTNDVSARDVQISHEQFNKAKSYRTFGPTGPYLVLVGKEEMARWRDLRLTLRVNGEVRQDGFASDMIFDPLQTLNELSEIRDFNSGDMIATGTPSGVALSVPPPFMMFLSRFVSPETKFKGFLRGQLKNDRYLKPGDTIEASIRTDDGAIDLGVQRNCVAEASSRSNDVSETTTMAAAQ